MAFIAAMAAVIVGGLLRAHPAVVLDHHLGASTEAVGILLVLKAFASGCSALTGVEAIANAVPQFRTPRARRAQRHRGLARHPARRDADRAGGSHP